MFGTGVEECLIVIWPGVTLTGCNFRLDATRGECAWELDGAWGDEQSFGFFQLVITKVLPVGCDVVERVYFPHRK